jgi:voltage-gated potassium channel
VTISTVGYGDQYPVTSAGRLVGALVIVVGVGIFGTFTGYLANFFLSPSKKSSEPGRDSAATDDPRSRLKHLQLLMTQQQAEVDRMSDLLGEQDA